jgi:hypothetical protein
MGEHYSDSVARTWLSAIKQSGLKDHLGDNLSYKGATEDYLEKNKPLYASVLKNGGDEVLNAARQHNPSIDAKIEQLTSVKMLTNDTVETAETGLSVIPKKKPSWFSAKKLLVTTALVGAVGLGGGSMYDSHVEDNLTDAFSATAYEVTNPKTMIEKCVVNGAVRAAVETVMKERSVFNIDSSRHKDVVWEEFRLATLNNADACEKQHRSNGFNVSDNEIQGLSQSMSIKINQER